MRNQSSGGRVQGSCGELAIPGKARGALRTPKSAERDSAKTKQGAGTAQGPAPSHVVFTGGR
eukprot:10813657-Alexandrium_andersonii.AAC.1